MKTADLPLKKTFSLQKTEQIRDGRSLSREHLIQKREDAMYLLKDNLNTVTKVARRLGVSRATIYKWCKMKGQAGGSKNLKRVSRRGPKTCISENTKAEIIQALRNGSVWTVAQTQKYAKLQLNTVVSKPSVRKILENNKAVPKGKSKDWFAFHSQETNDLPVSELAKQQHRNLYFLGQFRSSRFMYAITPKGNLYFCYGGKLMDFTFYLLRRAKKKIMIIYADKAFVLPKNSEEGAIHFLKVPETNVLSFVYHICK